MKQNAEIIYVFLAILILCTVLLSGCLGGEDFSLTSNYYEGYEEADIVDSESGFNPANNTLYLTNDSMYKDSDNVIHGTLEGIDYYVKDIYVHKVLKINVKKSYKGELGRGDIISVAGMQVYESQMMKLDFLGEEAFLKEQSFEDACIVRGGTDILIEQYDLSRLEYDVGDEFVLFLIDGSDDTYKNSIVYAVEGNDLNKYRQISYPSGSYATTGMAQGVFIRTADIFVREQYYLTTKVANSDEYDMLDDPVYDVKDMLKLLKKLSD